QHGQAPPEAPLRPGAFGAGRWHHQQGSTRARVQRANPLPVVWSDAYRLQAGRGGSQGSCVPQVRRRDLGMAEGNGRPRMQTRYFAEIVPALKERFGFTTVMQVPRLEKIVLNMGLGEAVREPKLIEIAVEDLQTIAGQKPIVTKARKSI